MKKWFIGIGVIILVGLIIALFYLQSTSQVESDAIKFKNEYEVLNGTTREKDGKTIRSITIADDNPFIYATEEEIVSKIEKGETFVVYFGFSDCPWCRSIVPTLIEVARDLEIKEIYYVDVKEIRDVIEVDETGELKTTTKGSDGYYQLIEIFSDVLDDYTVKDSNGETVSTKEKRIYAPNIVSVVDGVAQKIDSGISEKQTDGYMELTEEMKEDMYTKIKCVLNCVIEDNVCSAETKC